MKRYTQEFKGMDEPKKKLSKAQITMIAVGIIVILLSLSKTVTEALFRLLSGIIDMFTLFFNDYTYLILSVVMGISVLVIINGLFTLYKRRRKIVREETPQQPFTSEDPEMDPEEGEETGDVYDEPAVADKSPSWRPSSFQKWCSVFVVTVSIAVCVATWYWTLFAGIMFGLAAVGTTAIFFAGRWLVGLIRKSFSHEDENEGDKAIKTSIIVIGLVLGFIVLILIMFGVQLLWGPLGGENEVVKDVIKPSTFNKNGVFGSVFVLGVAAYIYYYFSREKVKKDPEPEVVGTDGKSKTPLTIKKEVSQYCKKHWIGVPIGIVATIGLLFLLFRIYQLPAGSISSPEPMEFLKHTWRNIILLIIGTVIAYFATYSIKDDKDLKFANALRDHIWWAAPLLFSVLSLIFVRVTSVTLAEGGKGGVEQGDEGRSAAGGGEITTAPSPQTAPAVAATSVVAKEVVATAGTASIATSSPEKFKWVPLEVPAGIGSRSKDIPSVGGMKINIRAPQKNGENPLILYVVNEDGDRCVVGECQNGVLADSYYVVNQTNTIVHARYKYVSKDTR